MSFKSRAIYERALLFNIMQIDLLLRPCGEQRHLVWITAASAIPLADKEKPWRFPRLLRLACLRRMWVDVDRPGLGEDQNSGYKKLTTETFAVVMIILRGGSGA